MDPQRKIKAVEKEKNMSVRKGEEKWGEVKQQNHYFNLIYCRWCITTRWFKYDWDYLCVNNSQFVPVIFEPPCTIKHNIQSHETNKNMNYSYSDVFRLVNWP